MNDNNIETVIVILPRIARILLHEGYRIVDMRPYRYPNGYVDMHQSVFYFEYKDGINERIEEIARKPRKVGKWIPQEEYQKMIKERLQSSTTKQEKSSEN